MKFLCMMKATSESEAGLPPEPAMMEAMGKLMEQSFKEGKMVMGAGLGPSSMGARVQTAGGKISVVDGPFAEIKELVAGFAIMELPSLEAAVQEGKRMMQLHLDVLGPGYEGTCEVRQMFD
ncbi:MAG: YciI family protein [Bryobacteraceae bacterium]